MTIRIAIDLGTTEWNILVGELEKALAFNEAVQRLRWATEAENELAAQRALVIRMTLNQIDTHS